MKKCSQMMSRDVACCMASATAQQVAELMKECQIGCVPVVTHTHDKTVIGIVTDRDLTIRVLGERRDPVSTTVKEVMTRQVVTCSSESDLDFALGLMEHHRVRRLPIVNELNQLVGMLTQADLAVKMNEPAKTASLMKSLSKPNIVL